DGPAQNQHHDERRGYQAATEIVEQFPSLQGRKRVGLRSMRSRYKPAKPGDQLPVAADPAMLPARIGVVASREVIKQLGIAEQPTPRVVALDQIVAEYMVLGERLTGGRLEGIHIVDSLADEAAQAEQVHVRVGSGRRIGIDTPRRRQQG